MIGATNEPIALTNCPSVRALASRSPCTIFDSSGFSETCMIALPMPSRQNDTSMIVNGGERNYVMATVSLFVSLFNLFTSLLSIFGFAGSSDD